MFGYWFGYELVRNLGYELVVLHLLLVWLQVGLGTSYLVRVNMDTAQLTPSKRETRNTSERLRTKHWVG